MAMRFQGRMEMVSALLFALVPLAFIGGITLDQLMINVPAENRVRAATIQSFDTIRIASEINDAIQDAERGQRGYLLTRRDAYLEPFAEGTQRIAPLMMQLQQASADSPDLQAVVLKLQADLTTKLNELNATLDALRRDGEAAAMATMNTDLGRIAMDAVQADLALILNTADGQLKQRLVAAAAVDSRVALTFLVGSIVSSLALITGALMLGRAYRRARSSEAVLQTTLDSVREGVAAADPQGRMRAWNESFAGLLRLPPQAVRAGARLEAGGAEAGAVAAQIRELDVAARRSGRPALVEHRLRDGTRLEVFHSPMEDGGYVTTFLDVTERRQAEEALRQAQKLEALGQMTGGVAHDFNNLLTIIVGNLGRLRALVGHDSKGAERLEMIRVAAERGARLTQQLLAFARRQPLQAEIVNLGHLMSEVLTLVRRAAGDAVVVECITSGGLWNTTVDATQFQSAVLNLAINGRDAMPEGGKLTIEVANAALDDAYGARHADVTPGQYVLFAITDTGAGMDAETMARALDPFFTTKPVGEGTGLGLPQVYGFVKQSGGHMKIYSEPGEGTTVKLYLPRSFAEQRDRPRSAPSLAVTGSETILLVDDDAVVRTTVAGMLEDLGYNVIEASGGTAGIEVLESGRKIDLLFTDVVMPGPINGRRLAERAAAIVPGIKVLFTSGYTENAIVHNGRLDPGVELLSKPYDRDTLAAKIRRVLDAPGREAREA